MQCQGKCNLKAKFAEQEEQEENHVFNFDKNTINWTVELWSDLLAKKPYKKGIVINIPYLLSFDIPFHTEIFHPPQSNRILHFFT